MFYDGLWFLGERLISLNQLLLNTLSIILNTLTTHECLCQSLHRAHMSLCDQGSDNILGMSINVYKALCQHEHCQYNWGLLASIWSLNIGFNYTYLGWRLSYESCPKIINKIMLCPSNNPLKHVLKWHYIVLYTCSYIHIYSHHVIHVLFTAYRRKNHSRFPSKHKQNIKKWYIQKSEYYSVVNELCYI